MRSTQKSKLKSFLLADSMTVDDESQMEKIADDGAVVCAVLQLEKKRTFWDYIWGVCQFITVFADQHCCVWWLFIINERYDTKKVFRENKCNYWKERSEPLRDQLKHFFCRIMKMKKLGIRNCRLSSVWMPLRCW